MSLSEIKIYDVFTINTGNGRDEYEVLYIDESDPETPYCCFEKSIAKGIKELAEANNCPYSEIIYNYNSDEYEYSDIWAWFSKEELLEKKVLRFAEIGKELVNHLNESVDDLHTVKSILKNGIGLSDREVEFFTEDFNDKAIKKEIEPSLSLIGKIKAHKENTAFLKQTEAKEQEIYINKLISQIQALKPRIDKLVETATACRKNGIALMNPPDYEKNNFTSHQTPIGFILNGINDVKEIGIDEVGAFKEYQFRTNGEVIYFILDESRYKFKLNGKVYKDTRPTFVPEAALSRQNISYEEAEQIIKENDYVYKNALYDIEVLENFLDRFDDFEKSFYNYVEKEITTTQETVNTTKSALTQYANKQKTGKTSSTEQER